MPLDRGIIELLAWPDDLDVEPCLLEAIDEVTPAVVRLLSRYATRKSGASVRLDAPAPLPA